MISLNNAYKIASHNTPDWLEIYKCIEIDDSYIFLQNPIGIQEIAPGGLNVRVRKSDGKTDTFNCGISTNKEDPYENIRLLMNGISYDKGFLSRID